MAYKKINKLFCWGILPGIVTLVLLSAGAAQPKGEPEVLTRLQMETLMGTCCDCGYCTGDTCDCGEPDRKSCRSDCSTGGCSSNSEADGPCEWCEADGSDDDTQDCSGYDDFCMCDDYTYCVGGAGLCKVCKLDYTSTPCDGTYDCDSDSTNGCSPSAGCSSCGNNLCKRKDKPCEGTVVCKCWKDIDGNTYNWSTGSGGRDCSLSTCPPGNCGDHCKDAGSWDCGGDTNCDCECGDPTNPAQTTFCTGGTFTNTQPAGGDGKLYYCGEIKGPLFGCGGSGGPVCCGSCSDQGWLGPYAYGCSHQNCIEHCTTRSNQICCGGNGTAQNMCDCPAAAGNKCFDNGNHGKCKSCTKVLATTKCSTVGCPDMGW